MIYLLIERCILPLLLVHALGCGSPTKVVLPSYDRLLPDGSLLPEMVAPGTLHYPGDARTFGIEGTITARILVTETGLVKEVTIIEKKIDYQKIDYSRMNRDVDVNRIFDKPTIDYFMESTFKPAIIDGVPHEASVIIPANYRLKGR
jgi:hypothetical protein